MRGHREDKMEETWPNNGGRHDRRMVDMEGHGEEMNRRHM